MGLLNPASIAVIGASAEEHKVGHHVFKNLLTQGFRGAVYPVNPKGGEILTHKVFAGIRDIPKPVDLAIIVTPAPTVPKVLRECGESGIRSVIVISAGFKETGTDEGKAREGEVRTIAEEYGMELLGPNCLGLLRPSIGLNASFAKSLPPEGNIALISQSGAFAVAMMDAATNHHLGFSLVLSIGNKTVLDECDALERCAEDPETSVIGLYLEGIKDGMRFREAAARVAAVKPIVLLKAGISAFGQRAAASHTGALAGSDGAIDALCAQTGIHRAHSLEEFTDLLQVLSSQPPLLSPRIAIVTNAGGPGILAADSAERHGLLLPSLTETIEQTLRERLPEAASTKNPIDLIGDAGSDRYASALDACFGDPTIDGIVVLLTPQVMTPVSDIAQAVIAATKRTSLMPIVASFMGEESVTEARALLADNGIPSFETPERAVRAMAALLKHGLQPGTAAAGGTKKLSSTPPRVRQAQNILQGKHGLLSDEATAQLLRLYHLPIPEQQLARSREEAVLFAQTIGYPVIAKVSSPQILHKTDVGGIRSGIDTEEELCAAFDGILKSVAEKAPEASVRGILIQKLLPVGSEFIVGGLRDPSFGPLVMAGLGGIYTELFRDVAFRLAPLSEVEGFAMLQELKAWKVLTGMRGKAPADITELVSIILKTAEMLYECPEIRELDFNPVIVHGDSITIADAKVITQ